MTLRFDENCLRPPNLASSANLLIVAWEDGQRLTFTVRRALLVRHLPAAERAELSPTLGPRDSARVHLRRWPRRSLQGC